MYSFSCGSFLRFFLGAAEGKAGPKLSSEEVPIMLVSDAQMRVK